MLVDLRGLIRGLHEHSVEYALIGAIAMVFYGYVRNTENGYVSVNFAARESDSMEISCHVGS